MNFKNLIEVSDYFSDDKNCIEFLESVRWQNGEVCCVFCNNDKTYKLPSVRAHYKCSLCKRMFSVIKRTIFEKSQIPLQKWFLAIYFITSHKKGISSCQLAKNLGVTQKSAWFMAQRIRFALKLKTPIEMDGIIQVDETYMGGKNKNKSYANKIANSQGRSLKSKTPVFGMVETGEYEMIERLHKIIKGKTVFEKVITKESFVFTEVIPNTKGATIKPIIGSIVNKGSAVVSDEWKAYKNMSKDYLHVVVNHTQAEYSRGGFHNNGIEGFWSLLKRGVYGIYHQVSPKHLDNYCDEFAFRYNTKNINDSQRFNLSMKKLECRMTYAELKSKKKKIVNI